MDGSIDVPSAGLNPVAHAAAIRSIQKELLAAASGSTSVDGADAVERLLAALETTSEKLALRSEQWQLYSALVLYRMNTAALRSEGSFDAASLQQCILVHLKATQDGAGMDASAYARYTSLLLHWHARYAGLSLPTTDDDEMEEAESRTHDPVQTATGLRGGPIVEADGTYLAASLPQVPTRASAEQNGALEALEPLLGEQAVREALREAYSRIAYDMAESQTTWRALLAFEQAYLGQEQTLARKEAVKHAFLTRLRVPHMQHEDTAQQLSSFCSQHLGPDEYEPTMEAASKAGAVAKEAYTERGSYEDRFVAARAAGDAAAIKPYLRWQVSRKPPDLLATSALYRRAIAAFAQPPSLTDEQLRNAPSPSYESQLKKARAGKGAAAAAAKAEKAELATKFAQAEGLWEDYVSFLIIYKGPPSEVLDSCRQAVRALPGSGKLWGAYLRSLARLQAGEAAIAEAFEQALQGGQCAREAASLAELLLGRCDAEKELTLLSAAAEQGVTPENVNLSGDITRFSQVYAVIETCLELAAQGSPDAQLRLVRFASGWCERCGAETALLADDLWTKALEAQQKNARAWLEAAQYCIRTGQSAKARALFKQVSGKAGVDDKTQLLDAWLAFEHVYGASADIEYAARKVKEETERAWDAYLRSYAAQQQQYDYAVAQQPAETSTTNGKRSADDALGAPEASTSAPAAAPAAPARDTAKKSKAAQKGPTKDREYCSVLVSKLVPGTTEQDVRVLFRGCGEILEVTGPRELTDGTASALVEFTDREAIPAARTRDKKQVRGAEVEVHVGHECTLYVTNFPEAWTDDEVRARFGAYGPIFDVRWPSKKYAAGRRFCYVGLASPAAARAALREDGQRLTELNTLHVALSDPERRKVRTDAHATEREVYITGVPSAGLDAPEEALRALFAPHGAVEAVRVPRNDAGRPRGIAFVDFSTPLEAQRAAAEVNGALLGGKPLKVSIASRAGAHSGSGGAGAGGKAGPSGGQGFRSRAVRIRGLPDDAQEALIQQLVEKVTGPGSVQKVEWTPGPNSKGEAIVELTDPATAGKFVLSPKLVYGLGTPLTVSSLERGGAAMGSIAAMAAAASGSKSAAPAPTSATAFAPRAARAGTRARPGLGHQHHQQAQRKARASDAMDTDDGDAAGAAAAASQDAEASTSAAPAVPAAGKKGQDAFRAMLQ